eukprot:9694108-Karenia_brevis.AAC.1
MSEIGTIPIQLSWTVNSQKGRGKFRSTRLLPPSLRPGVTPLPRQVIHNSQLHFRGRRSRAKESQTEKEKIRARSQANAVLAVDCKQ